MVEYSVYKREGCWKSMKKVITMIKDQVCWIEDGSQILTAGVLDFCLEHSYCLNQKAVILVIF